MVWLVNIMPQPLYTGKEYRFPFYVCSCGQQECKMYLFEALGVCVNETMLHPLPASKRHQLPDVQKSIFPDSTLDKYVPSTNHPGPRKCASLSGVIARDSTGRVWYIILSSNRLHKSFRSPALKTEAVHSFQKW